MVLDSPKAEPWTVLGLLNKAGAYLKARRVESPRASAEILLAHVLELERIALYVRYDQPVTAEELDRFREAVSRRAKGEPAAYIVGTKEFFGMPFSVNRDVLIPRPETEHLVEAALKRLQGPAGPEGRWKRVLDLGTGSGAIAIALAMHAEKASLFASDASFSALRLARQNAKRHGLGDRIRFICGKWFSPFRGTGCAFDVILSNPPYVPGDSIPGLQPEIGYEPRQALDGGPDGLDALRRILLEAFAFMAPGGVLLMEIGFDQKSALEALIEKTGRYKNPFFIKDYSGLYRVVSLDKA